MDWGNVTPGEVLSSLQEVDWSQAPHSPAELLAHFSVPSNGKKLEARVKCNVYYYRANYLIIVVTVLVLSFLRRPSAFLALLFLLLGGLCLNNTFALSTSNSLLKVVRRIHSPTALRLRAISGGHSGLGAPGRTYSDVKILGVPRKLVVASFMGLALILLFRKGVLWHLLLTLILGVSLVGLHSVFRVPNLKTRLASAREEFRAVWRGYQADHDYMA